MEGENRTAAIIALFVGVPLLTAAFAYTSVFLPGVYDSPALFLFLALAAAAVPLTGAAFLRRLRAHIAVRIVLGIVLVLFCLAGLLSVFVVTAVQLVPVTVASSMAVVMLLWPLRGAVVRTRKPFSDMTEDEKAALAEQLRGDVADSTGHSPQAGETETDEGNGP